MALASNIALARVLAGGTGQGVYEAADIEEQREREQELARAIKGQERGRRAQRQMGQGRLVGGGIGALLGTLLAPATGGLSLLIPALAAGAGSFAGQKIQTRKTAKEKLGAIDVGSFQRARGRERETEFKAGERAFGGDLASMIGAGAVKDAMNALALQGLLSAGTKAGVSFPVRQSLDLGELPGPFLPSSLAGLSDIDRRGIFSILESLGGVEPSYGPKPGSMGQSLLRTLRR